MKQAKEGKRRRTLTAVMREEMPCTDTAVLRGERCATVYGCHRILYYAPERICLAVGKRRVSVIGRELLCTSFSAGCVTVAGEVEGILYCDGTCEGGCPREGT